MLDVPNIIKSVISNEYTVKNHRIEFLDMQKADLTNNNLVYDSFSFSESVCSQDQFAFGLSEASSVQFETVDTDDYKVGNILDQRIRVSLEYKLTTEQAAEVAGDQNLHEREDIGGYWYTIPIGIFYVEECPRNHENMAHRQVTAYSRNERNFNINLAGVYKEDSFAFQPDLLMSVPNILTSDMTPITNRSNMSIKTGWNSAQTTYFSLNGGAVGYKYETLTLNAIDKVFVVRAEYTEDDLDKSIALDMMNLAISKLPSGASSCSYADWTPTERVFSSGTTAAIINSGCMQPCVSLILYDYTDNKTVYSYPIFIKPGKNILIDPSQLIPSYKPSGYSAANVAACRLQFRIITRWFNAKAGSGSSTAFPTRWTQSYSDDRADKDYTDFSSDWPVDQYHERSNINEINVYYKILDKTAFSSSYVTIKSTLETNKSELGTYHMFSNAVSTEDLLGGYAEVNASFLKQDRNGTFTLKHLDNSNPIQLNASDTVQNAWWDEYDVEDVGKIRYTYTNAAGEEVTTTYSRDASKKSVYDMTDNFLLKNMLLVPPTAISDPPDANTDTSKNYRFTSATKTVDGFTWTKGHVYYYLNEAWHDAGKYNKYATMAKILLEKGFVPYISTMKFTPIEATFANVPYMEAGDAFTFTTKDGQSTVSSYIMRQTISGSQKITSQVECVDGQIISREVEDDE